MHEFRKLEPRQQAALLYKVIFNISDNHLIFKIAEGQQRYDNLKNSSKNVTVSRWWLSEDIQKGFVDLGYILENKLHDENLKYYNNRVETETTKESRPDQVAEEVNFLNLDEFLQFANKQANELKDEKDKRAYLDMIAKLMNFKESEEETDQIRAYVPQTCDRCPLYQAAKDDETL